MKAIIDTSGWYSMIVEADGLHKKAKIFCEKEEREFLILDTVFEEIIALFTNRFGKQKAIKSGQILLEMGLQVLNKKERLDSWELFKQTSRDVSFVDCTVVAVAEKLNLPVFGFDKKMEKLGVKLVP